MNPRCTVGASSHGRTRDVRALGWSCALLLAASQARADAGGPDAFGYTFLDSDSGGPAGNYEVGTDADTLSLADDGSAVVAFEAGFVFPYYGMSFSSVRVHNNGGLTFTGDGDLPWDHECPLSSLSRAAILGWWGDLAQAAAFNEGVYTWTGGSPGARYFVVEWYEMRPYQHSDPVTFEIKLFAADGRIEVHYDDVDTSPDDADNGALAAVGLTSSTTLLPYSCDVSSLRNDFAIAFYPPACTDEDDDGSCLPVDCDDGDSAVHPGATEICDGRDTNCDHVLLNGEEDSDGDGYGLCMGDCDDDDARRTPADADGDGASSCDGDCDDEDPLRSPTDVDGDGHSGCEGDCDDADPDVGIEDLDGDGQTACAGDCDDRSPTTHQGAAEVCNGQDDDCDGPTDEDLRCGDDDDSEPPGHDIAYGCIADCTVSGDPAPVPFGAVALLALLGPRRRR